MDAPIHAMEDAPEFKAGRGAALTSDGIAQMDACLMTGDGEVGAVTGVSTVKNPIDAARAVKEQTKHVLFADPTDAEIADWGVATESNEYFITEQRRQSLAEAQSGGDEWEKHGTIGAVARDQIEDRIRGPARQIDKLLTALGPEFCQQLVDFSLNFYSVAGKMLDRFNYRGGCLPLFGVLTVRLF